MAGADADIPPPAPDLLEPTNLEAVHALLASQKVENTTADDVQAEATAPTPKATVREQSSNKLKDLFAPLEGGGQFLTMSNRLSLTSPCFRPSQTSFPSLVTSISTRSSTSTWTKT